MRIAVAGGTGTVGSKVVAAARAKGHSVVVLSRSSGVDIFKGDGLETRLTGVDAVIDTLSINTLSADKASKFFRRTATNLLDAAYQAGVEHAVLLSIVGVDLNRNGYYAGKLIEENVFAYSAVPWTIVRATQFHEFAEQMFHRTKVGPLVLAPHARTQPIAAREVAEHLLELATGPAQGRATELAGPREEDLADMVKSYADAVEHRGPVLAVKLPGAQMKGMREGLNLPGANAVLGSQTFAEWVASAS